MATSVPGGTHFPLKHRKNCETLFKSGDGRGGGRALSKLWMLIGLVVGVGAASVLLGWMMSRLAKSMDRVQRDPKYKRRMLVYGAAPYAFGIVAGVWQVLSGAASPVALLALPIPLIFLWIFLRAAKRLKIPPG